MLLFQRCCVVVAVTAIILITAMGQAVGLGPARVLILPFKMNTPQETTYLQQGIQDMLTSRILQTNRVEVVSKIDAMKAFKQVNGHIDAGTAQQFGNNLGAQYVIFGSITMIGQNVSLDANMIDIKGIKPPINISSQSAGLDDVIPRINEFAEQINADVFAGNPERIVKLQPNQETMLEPRSSDSLPSHRRHPDSLLTGREGQQLSPLNPNFIVAVGGDTREGKFWRSPSVKMNITGMDVGDVDGDGLNEVVYASNNAVYVFQFADGQFVLKGNYKTHAGNRFFGLDIADVDGNGRPEIIIANQSNFLPSSMVLEFRDGKLVLVQDQIPYYLRMAALPTGYRLVGQRGDRSDAFTGGVYLMSCSSGRYVPDQNLNLPKGANAFNFAMTDQSGTGSEQVILIDQDDKLIVKSRNGEELWQSKKTFCGTSNYVLSAWSADDILVNKGSGPKKTYIPSRILLQDLNEDGKQEILAAQNETSGMSSLLKKWRVFKRGALFSMSYTQMSLGENWRSKQLPGALTDYHIKDFDNDGRPDLVVAVVMKSGSGIEDARSAIVAYELATPGEMQDAERRAME